MTTPHRTQFDRELLAEQGEPLICRNHGRQVLVRPDGSVLTALAWGGSSPRLRLHKNHDLIADHPLRGQPSPPCLVAASNATVSLWMSLNGQVCFSSDLKNAPLPAVEITGELEDVAVDARGGTMLALRRGTALSLLTAQTPKADPLLLDDNAGHASLEFDEEGTLHVAFEKLHGIDYRHIQLDGSKLRIIRSERAAEAFGYHPVLLTHRGKVFLGYLGESWCPPSEDPELWKVKSRNRRLGLGGYIAVLIFENARWRRCMLADSKQFAKPLWPKTRKFGYDYPSVDARVRLDEFSPPSLCLGSDGVVQALWANVARRWIYASRFLGESFSPAAEVRGPLEALTGPCLLPKFVVPPSGGNRDKPTRVGTPNALPLVMVTKTRVYLDAIRLPSPDVQNGRRIDFLQPDELAVCRGLELKVNPMQRFSGNPVMRPGGLGSFDEIGLSVIVSRDGDGWRAHCLSKSRRRGWWKEFPPTSADGIHWHRPGPLPENLTYTIGDFTDKLAAQAIRHIQDPEEPDPTRRYKGLWLKPKTPWGTFQPVVSADGEHWQTAGDARPIMCDEDVFIWRDESDIPERRFKATGNARSFCGRVCAQWVSPDGVHWHDRRDTLDFDDPFGSEPYWCDDYPHGSTGRILVDPWAGPDDEEEIHSGFVFRDGDRWLLQYMKWTPDGHVIPALACSRDGINFTRVGFGTPTISLGDPGSWESGRLALRNPPYLVGDVWRQYYMGSSWKHGFGGKGKKPQPGGAELVVYSPVQVGFAEMAKGHWAHLQVDRVSHGGSLITIPWRIERPHSLALDVEGLDHSGSEITCAVMDATGESPLAEFDFSRCDRIRHKEPPVSWRGVGFEEIGSGTFRIAVHWSGHGVKLFGFDLRPTAHS